jgi:2-polyprenyl-3-methyl-5-hydroxy-6-metoxy-1,4-benzoquinol methylase
VPVSSAPASHVEQVHRLFDDKAVDWADHYRPDGPLLGRLNQVAATVEQLTSPGSAVLDLGCASGELARFLARSGFRLTGADVSGKMLSQARQAEAGGSARWVQIDPAWQRLPFGPASFSTVVMSSVLEYVESPATVMAECARILQPGGTLVCTVPNLAHPVRWLEWIGRRAAGAAPARALAATRDRGRDRSRDWGRLGPYLTYLRISRQRHRRNWWETVAGQAGLQPVPLAARAAGRPTLRLLVFRVGPWDGAER